MRRLALAVAAAASCACGSGLPGTGPACPADPSRGTTVEFVVVADTIATTVRHDLDLNGIAALPGVETLGPGGKFQGMTIAEHRLDYRTGIAVSRHLFGGPQCAWIERVTVDMTPRKMEVYLPREYPEGSCEYDQVLAHERSHVDTHFDVLADSADKMRRALAAASGLPARGAPLQVKDRAEAEKLVDDALDAAARPVFAEFKKTLAERQAVIDLPENYRWTASRCRDWK